MLDSRLGLGTADGPGGKHVEGGHDIDCRAGPVRRFARDGAGRLGAAYRLKQLLKRRAALVHSQHALGSQELGQAADQLGIQPTAPAISTALAGPGSTWSNSFRSQAPTSAAIRADWSLSQSR